MHLRDVFPADGPAMVPAAFLPAGVENALAEVISWLVIVIVPVALLALYGWIHVLPEKIEEKRAHPQTAAIKALCLLSLFFGGLLWPVALLWANTKPVMYKLAYGVDESDHKTAGGDDDDASDIAESKITTLPSAPTLPEEEG